MRSPAPLSLVVRNDLAYAHLRHCLRAGASEPSSAVTVPKEAHTRSPRGPQVLPQHSALALLHLSVTGWGFWPLALRGLPGRLAVTADSRKIRRRSTLLGDFKCARQNQSPSTFEAFPYRATLGGSLTRAVHRSSGRPPWIDAVPSGWWKARAQGQRWPVTSDDLHQVRTRAGDR